MSQSEIRAQYARNWRIRNHERISAYERAYRARPDVKERNRANRAIYIRNNWERIRIQRHLRYLRDREKVRAYLARPEVHEKRLEYGRIYRASSQYRENHRIHQADLRRKAMLLVGSGVIRCTYCGCNDPECIEFNHIRGGGGRERRGGIRGPKSFALIMEDIEFRKQFELTCHVCNAAHYMKLRGKEGWMIHWVNK